ncbi:MAG: MEMO1 family protein [Candidatus Magasanikbacteria bacterium]|nr:MEMO1 family protein [Candidatus Magasanikbacteria bacterium]
MSLAFAAITPHPPLLLPTIGANQADKLTATRNALARLEEELYLAKPNLLIIISPHGNLLEDAFTVNAAPELETDLRDFGDLTTRLTFKGTADLPHRIRGAAKAEGIPTVLISERRLDYGAGVPLYFLTPHLSGITIIPLGFSRLDYKTHFTFGTLLKETIMKSNKRVALIASADLSHALSSEAPAGFAAAGSTFDATVQECLATGNTTALLQLDPAAVQPAAECGLRSILILLGALRHVNYTYEAYAYEAPFGVGYLTANFSL